MDNTLYLMKLVICSIQEIAGQFNYMFSGGGSFSQVLRLLKFLYKHYQRLADFHYSTAHFHQTAIQIVHEPNQSKAVHYNPAHTDSMLKKTWGGNSEKGIWFKGYR